MTPIARKQNGFVMIYALGVLIFIAVIALSLAYVLRLEAKLAIHDKNSAKIELAMRGALQYTLSQLARARALKPMLDSGQAPKEALWSIDAGPYQVQFDDIDILVDFGRVNPDINLVKRDVLARLLLYLGAQNMEEALHYADIIIGARDKIDPSLVAKMAEAGTAPGTSSANTAGTGNPPSPPPANPVTPNTAAPSTTTSAPQATSPAPQTAVAPGTPAQNTLKGFARIEEVLALEAIPLALRTSNKLAKKSKDGNTEIEPPKPGLAQLFSVGTGATGLDVNRSDLALVAAYSNAPLEKLIEFDRRRRQKPLTPEEGATLLGEGAKNIFTPTNDATVKLKLTSTNPIYPAVAEAVIEPKSSPPPGKILKFERQPLDIAR